MSWTPPEDYTLSPGISAYPPTLTRRADKAEFKRAVMATQSGTPTEVNLSPAKARKADDERIAPIGLYPSAMAIALSKEN